MNPTPAVIFDLDGTLIDSLADIADAMNRTLSRFGYPGYDYESYKYFVGNGLKNLVYQCLPPDKRNEEQVMNCLAMMMEEYGRATVKKTRLYDGIPELLDELTKRNIKMAILSNKADELTQKICVQLLSQWHFELIMGDSKRFPRKPEPDSALFIAKTIFTPPGDIFYLGDTNIDMKTALAAGMFAVGVTWGFRSVDELEKSGAQLIIDSPIKLLNAL